MPRLWHEWREMRLMWSHDQLPVFHGHVEAQTAVDNIPDSHYTNVTAARWRQCGSHCLVTAAQAPQHCAMRASELRTATSATATVSRSFFLISPCGCVLRTAWSEGDGRLWVGPSGGCLQLAPAGATRRRMPTANECSSCSHTMWIAAPCPRSSKQGTPPRILQHAVGTSGRRRSRRDL